MPRVSLTPALAFVAVLSLAFSPPSRAQPRRPRTQSGVAEARPRPDAAGSLLDRVTLALRRSLEMPASISPSEWPRLSALLEVVVESDGSVGRAVFVRRSGDADYDAAVAAAIARVLEPGFTIGAIDGRDRALVGRYLRVAVTPPEPSRSPIDEPALGRDAIRGVVETHLDEIAACYEEGLGRVPRMAGRVTTRFVVGANGAVLSSEVASTTLRDAVVEECIRARVASWVFPPPAGNGRAVVTYPFTLTPAPEAD